MHTAWSRDLRVTADGTGVVSHAGAALPRMLADRTGLTKALSAALARRGWWPVHDRGRVLVDLAVMIADGGEAICDIDVLRNQVRCSVRWPRRRRAGAPSTRSARRSWAGSRRRGRKSAPESGRAPPPRWAGLKDKIAGGDTPAWTSCRTSSPRHRRRADLRRRCLHQRIARRDRRWCTRGLLRRSKPSSHVSPSPLSPARPEASAPPISRMSSHAADRALRAVTGPSYDWPHGRAEISAADQGPEVRCRSPETSAACPAW